VNIGSRGGGYSREIFEDLRLFCSLPGTSYNEIALR
jgi:hypothetical protein